MDSGIVAFKATPVSNNGAVSPPALDNDNIIPVIIPDAEYGRI